MQRFETKAEFTCPVCNKNVSTSVAVPEPNWSAGEKISDLTSEDQTEVRCPECETLFDAYVHNGASSCDITLDNYPATTVHADIAFFSPPDEDDDWLNSEPPEDPYSVFMDSYHHTGDLLAEHGGDGAHLMNRMVFAHQIGALEAYLGDVLIKEALSNAQVLHRLIAGDTELAKERFHIGQIVADPHLVNNCVKKYLRSIIYHNLAKVRALYRLAFQIDLFHMLGDEKKALLRAVEYRHDCVHRNGFDEDGKKLNVFTKEYVQEIANTMKTLVEKVERDLPR